MFGNFGAREGAPRTLRRGAFTLIELLAVVSVVTILAALLLSTLSRTRDKADAAVCRSNLRQIGIGLQAYLGDFERYPPTDHGYLALAAYAGEAYRTNRGDVTFGDEWVGGGKSVYQCPGRQVGPDR